MESNTPEADRKALLVAEAKTLKVLVDQNWSVDQIEAAVAKKRPKPAPAAVEGAVEGADEFDEIKASAAKAEAEMAHLRAQLAAAQAANLELFEAKGAAELELFELKQDAAGIPDVPEASDDFSPKREVEEPKPAPAAPTAAAPKTEKMVRCIVTKHGHNQLFTGRDDNSRHAAKEELVLPESVAMGQEARGFVEIQ